MHRVINTRIKQPEIQKNLIERKKINTLLKNGWNKKITIIEAGAGRGKTTAVNYFLSTLPKTISIKWISLYQDCNQLFVFWSYIIDSLQSFLDNEIDIFFHIGINEQTIDDLVAYLVNMVLDAPEMIIVLDDVHFITDSFVIQTIETFIEQMPSTVHFILLTRQKLPLYLGKFEMDDQLQYIKESALFLSKDEAEKLIKQFPDTAKLDNQDRNQLIIAANGWIGGLKLLLCGYDRDRKCSFNVSTNNTILFQYLSNEIFDNLSVEEQQFLTKTSCFPYITEQTVLELVKEKKWDFKKMMNRLINKNLLISCIDQENQSYQYHPIFKDFLKIKFEELPKKEQQVIIYKGALSFIHQKAIDEGFQLLIDIEEYEVLMTYLLKEKEMTRTMYYFGKIPLEFALSNIDFTYQKFFYHYSILEFDYCYLLLEKLAEKYPDVEEVQVTDGLNMLLGNPSISSSKNKEIISLAAIQALDLNPVSKGFLLLKNAVILFYQNQYREALDFTKISLALDQQKQHPFLIYFGQTLLGQIYEELGELNLALAQLEMVENKKQRFIVSEKVKQNLEISFNITIIGIYLKRLELEKADEALKKSYSNLRSEMNNAYNYNYAEYLYLSQQPEKAFEVLKKINTNPFNEYSSLLSRSGLFKYSLKENQLTNYFKDQFIQEFLSNETTQAQEGRLFYCMILLGKRENKLALEQIDQLLSMSRAAKNALKIVEGCLLKIQIKFALNESMDMEVKNLYNECIYYACENRILAPFFLYKQEINQLNEEFGAAIIENLGSKERSFHKEILQLYETKKNTSLTEREVEVLFEISKGCTNKEIAKKLYISLATVKTHILNIYRKLEVNSRISAVEKAKNCSIL